MSISSKIIFCKNIKMDRDNNNVLTLSEADMLTLVNSNGIKVAESNNYSFIGRGDRDAIDVSLAYTTLLGCNYIAFQNTNYNNKWYFAFIDKIEYINDGTSRVHYTVDIFATWWSYWSPKQCFVIREHVNDDTVGSNTIPENLETGEYICYSTQSLYTVGTCYIAVGVTEVVDEIDQNPFNTRYNGIYSGIKYILCETPLAATNLIRGYDAKGKGDAISLIFLIPTALCGTVTFSTVTIEGITTQIAKLPYSDTATLLNSVDNITAPSYFGTYTPINNKMKVYPYMYFYVSNNAGQDVVYHYEDFVNNTASFKTYGAVTPGCSIRCVPIDYKKLLDTSTPSQSLRSYNYGITGAKLPICSWNSDPYTNWLTQNGVNIAGQTYTQQEISGIAGVGSMLLGGLLMATGVGGLAGAGLMAGGAAGIFNSMQSNYQKDIIPLQAKGNTSGGDVQYATGWDKIQLFKMTIRPEYAKCIDDFFTKFGYKVNRLKLANQTGRTNWNYVEIGKGEIMCYQKNDVVAIPAQDLININKLYQRGITLWHSHSALGDYSLTNTIVVT